MRYTVFLLLTLCGPSSASDSIGDAQRGEQLFSQYACYSCHGYNGTGMTPLASKTEGILSSPQLYLTYMRLRADQNPVNPSRAMPNYSTASLSDEQALDIYAYILTLDDEPPEVEEIPEFTAIIESADRRIESETNDP